MNAAMVGGRYEVLERLGQGAMGTVYRARDTRLLREVALKVLQESDNLEQALFYFHREARAVAALEHPNIVPIYDYSGPDETQAFLVMPLVRGSTLEGLWGKHRGQPESIVLAFLASIAAGLAHAHAAGVIHRDVKPGNVMVNTTTGIALLTDFGLAKGYRTAEMLGKTAAGKKTQLMGTPEFIAPEQIIADDSGPDSDVFSLGSLAYWVAVGESPFVHEDLIECLRRVRDVDYRALAQVRPSLSAGCRNLIEQCLRRSPSDRPTAAEIEKRARKLLRELGRPEPAQVILTSLNPNAAGDGATAITHVGASPEATVTTTVTGVGGTNEATVLHDPRQAPRQTTGQGQTSDPNAETYKIKKEGPDTERDPRRAAKSNRTLLLGAGVALCGTLLGLGGLAFFRADSAVVTAQSTDNAAPTPSAASPAVIVTPSVTVAATPTQVVTTTPAASATLPAPPAPSAPASPMIAIAPSVTPTPAPAPAESADVPPAPPTKNIPAAPRKPTEEARPPTGPQQVAIDVKPWGEVFLDGKSLGNTPFVHMLRASPGPHEVSVVHPQLGRRERTVHFGKDRKVAFDLTK